MVMSRTMHGCVSSTLSLKFMRYATAQRQHPHDRGTWYRSKQRKVGAFGVESLKPVCPQVEFVTRQPLLGPRRTPADIELRFD